MKKTIFLMLAFCLFATTFLPTHLFCSASLQDSASYVVTANFANVYQSPEFSDNVVEKLTHGQVVKVEMEGEVAKKFQSGTFEFFKTQNGYVFCDLLVPEREVIESIPNFNAKTNRQCNVFFQVEDKFEENAQISLQKGQPIFLYQGFDTEKPYIAVAFVQDGKVIYGFLEKDAISPNGINPILISCAVLIVAILGIIFAWLFMKKKKYNLKK